MQKLTSADFKEDPSNKSLLVANSPPYRVEIGATPDGMIIFIPSAPKNCRAAFVSLGKTKKVLKANPDAINMKGLTDKMTDNAIKEANKLLTKIENYEG
jgi:hypothetical protein